MLPVIIGAAALYGLYRLLSASEPERGSKAIADTSAQLEAFYGESVRLPASLQAQLRLRRDTNRERLVRALSEARRPAPSRFVIQGSYAMDTIIRQPDNDYDIDD